MPDSLSEFFARYWWAVLAAGVAVVVVVLRIGWGRRVKLPEEL